MDTTDGATDDSASGDDTWTDEVWTYHGRRAHQGKRLSAWLDAHGRQRLYVKLPALGIGGKYTIAVRRDGDRVYVHGEPRYTGQRADETTRRHLEALDVIAAAELATAARDRNDARRKALDDAIAPLAELAGKLAFGHERDALLAHVIRRITARW